MTDFPELLAEIQRVAGSGYTLRFNSWVERGERTFFTDISGVGFGHNREPEDSVREALEGLGRKGSKGVGRHSVMLLSIMHTGTTFLKELISPHMFRHIHEQEALNQAEGADTIAVPLRHPAKVWKSFRWRGRSEPVFWLSWALLDWYDRRYGTKIVYVPVDLPGVRDSQLVRLGGRSGQDYTTDWTPRNEWSRERVEVEVPDLSEVLNYEVVRRFYHDIHP